MNFGNKYLILSQIMGKRDRFLLQIMGKWEKLRLKSWAKRLKSVAISVFLMRLRHISYGIVLRCYSEKLLLSFGILNKISYLCEKFRYEKIR